MRPTRVFRRIFMVPLSLLLGTTSSFAFSLLSSNQVVFVDVDHAPVGACSTLAYGLTAASGPWASIRGDYGCGLGMSSGAVPYFNGGGGVVIAVGGGGAIQALPFVASPASIASTASYFSTPAMHRVLSPCADQWTVDGVGLTFTHYSPAWSMPSLASASVSDRKRFFLPATWIQYTVNNTNAYAEDLYFGLPAAAAQTSLSGGAYQGFVIGEAVLAVRAGACDLLSGTSLHAALNGLNQGCAFHLRVPPGQTGSLTVVVAHYRKAVVDSRIGATYYYTSLFASVDSVVDSAFAGFADARARCQQMADAMAGAGLNFYRQFLACHALHSYLANTACLVDPSGNVFWRVTEGNYNYINTFDLSVDLAFYESLMHPWTLRNVLDTFSGALPGTGYSFDQPLYTANYATEVSAHGFSFHHDLGNWPVSVAPGSGSGFDDYMGAEQLQNWILDAGLYWSQSQDNAWLTDNLALLQTCLNSLLLRDNPNVTAGNGITKYVNDPELTTFDDLGASLRSAAYSGRIAVRNWACYVALQAMFGQAGDPADAAFCQTMAATTAQTIASLWAANRSSLGFIPALLDGSSQAAIIPMVEGLAYPLQMGLTNAVDSTGGPYVSMLRALSNHLAAVLVPGRCLNATSGAWDMTTETAYFQPHKIWHSKVYTAQYVAERVLGLTGPNINGAVDQVHATLMAQTAPFYEFSDENDASGGAGFVGGTHYPRGVTSALWWLTPTNNPGYPVPAAAPAPPAGLSASPGNRQIRLSWDGVVLAQGYNVKRSTVSGGPYAIVASSVAGASCVDNSLVNGTYYFYVVTATNQAGESLPSVEASAMSGGPPPAVGTNVAAVVGNRTLTLSWPSNYVGWILQTNTTSLLNPAAWGDVSNSNTNLQMTFPLPNAAVAEEFFRLRHP